LGDLYLEQARYNEAARCFGASLTDWPNHGSTYRSIAEALLRKGDDPAIALKTSKLAVDKERALTVFPQEVRDTNLGEELATLAWAVAVASQDAAQVGVLVAEAESKVGTRLVTSRAQVQYLAGLAYAVLGETERRARHFKEASRIDSRGRWGRAAGAATQQ
jgi:tetratricopeptide (TPR) repeat protein